MDKAKPCQSCKTGKIVLTLTHAEAVAAARELEDSLDSAEQNGLTGTSHRAARRALAKLHHVMLDHVRNDWRKP